MSYNRTNALAFARKYWNKVCSDNYVATGPKPDVPCPSGTLFTQEVGNGTFLGETLRLPSGSVIAWSDLDDCTHYVSCCIGIPPGDVGGGLDIRSDFNTVYGKVSAHKLFVYLQDKNLITVVAKDVSYQAAEPKLAQLQAGDLIFYRRKIYGEYEHSAVYLAGAKQRIACHTYCRCDVNDDYPQEWKSVLIGTDDPAAIVCTLAQVR